MGPTRPTSDRRIIVPVNVLKAFAATKGDESWVAEVLRIGAEMEARGCTVAYLYDREACTVSAVDIGHV